MNKSIIYKRLLISHITIFSFLLPSYTLAEVINLNTATKEELLASSIDMNRDLIINLIDYRNTHGSFMSVEDLMKVDGMNNALILRLGIYKDQQGNMVIDIPDEDMPEGMSLPLY